jgi:xylulokinase
LKHSGQPVGTITPQAARETGLATDTVVTVGPLDQVAGAVGAGNIAPGIVTETTGAALAICATVDAPTYDPGKRFPCHTHAITGKYILLSWVPTAGMALRWFRDEFGRQEQLQAREAGTEAYTLLCEQAASVPPGCEGLVMLPHLSGAACPEFNPRARGVFFGFTLGHTKAHFTRAVLEAIAFLLRSNLSLLVEHGVPVTEVRSLGGASRSDLWLQIKADVIGKPIVRLAAEEAAALGTAILGGVGIGLFGSVADACSRMVSTEKRFTPNPANREVYDRQFERYRELYDALVGLFAKA